MSLFSKEGINIKASVKFIDVNEFRKKNLQALTAGKAKVEKTQEEIDEDERLARDLSQGYERNRPKYDVNFIEKNRDVNKANLTRCGSPVQPWAERSAFAEVRRNSVRESRKKIRLAYMIKWEYVRKRRAEMLEV
jgi:hypothetical protein